MSGMKRQLVTLSVPILFVLFSPALNARAADHVVGTSELHRSVVQASEVREQNVEKVQAFFQQGRVQGALKTARIDQRKIVNAVPTLGDAEVARLAQATDKAQKDFAAGSLTNEQLTYIVIALATAVIVILIVEH